MGARDSRADILDDDPFRNTRGQPRIHRVHQRVDDRGTLHFETNGSFGNALMQFLNQSTWEKPKHHTGRLWHFSKTEKNHLALAMAAFTLALGFMSVYGISGINEYGFSKWLVLLLLSMPVMFIAVGPAFLVHEIGHKLVAKKNGCWAEFRADPKGLQFGVIISLLLGFVFMAPGAVMVAGVVTRRQNGHIAVAGPLTNLGLFLIGIPVWGLILGLSGAFDGVATANRITASDYISNGSLVWQAILIHAGVFWLQANLILGLFNMLPFGPLDGLKIKDWSERVFYLVLLIFAVPVFLWFSQVWSPMGVLHAIAESVSNIVR